MKTSFVLMAIYGSIALAGNLAHAVSDYHLVCNGADFEAPLNIDVQGARASADGSWDVIDAIGEGKYENLSVTQDGDVVTIVEIAQENAKPAFKAVLTISENGKYSGHAYMRDQSGLGVPSYYDHVSCERK